VLRIGKVDRCDHLCITELKRVYVVWHKVEGIALTYIYVQ